MIIIFLAGNVLKPALKIKKKKIVEEIVTITIAEDWNAFTYYD